MQEKASDQRTVFSTTAIDSAKEATISNLSLKAAAMLAAIREKKPLVHNITNLVVMNITANALLSMGASPVMAHAENEVEEMVSLADALVLNIGTLTDEWIASMIRAGKKATLLNTPIVFDPVGAGATPFRTESAQKIINQVNVRVIRGNASEILSLRRSDSKTKGVDSGHSVEEAAEIAKTLAGERETTIAVTGPMDLVTDGHTAFRVENGHPLMGRVTGTGCTATAVIGAFLAVDDDPLMAAVSALAFFGLAGERAAQRAQAPGSFQVALMDALYTLTPADVNAGVKITEMK